MSAETSVQENALVSPESIPLNRQVLVEEQQRDSSLAYALNVATCVREARDVPTNYFVTVGILFWKCRPAAQPANEKWTVHEQVVMPLGYHLDSSLGGHLGGKKTFEPISQHFYEWSIGKDVQLFLSFLSYMSGGGKPGRAPLVAPLQLLPIEQEPFSHIMIDCVGPLPKTKWGTKYFLTILDVATHYPEAFLLMSIKANVIVDHLVKFFSWAGLPCAIQFNRGFNFTSKLYQ